MYQFEMKSSIYPILKDRELFNTFSPSHQVLTNLAQPLFLYPMYSIIFQWQNVYIHGQQHFDT